MFVLKLFVIQNVLQGCIVGIKMIKYMKLHIIYFKETKITIKKKVELNQKKYKIMN